MRTKVAKKCAGKLVAGAAKRGKTALVQGLPDIESWKTWEVSKKHPVLMVDDLTVYPDQATAYLHMERILEPAINRLCRYPIDLKFQECGMIRTAWGFNMTEPVKDGRTRGQVRFDNAMRLYELADQMVWMCEELLPPQSSLKFRARMVRRNAHELLIVRSVCCGGF